MEWVTNLQVEEYIKSLPFEEDTVLKEMEEFGKKTNFPIVGNLVGRFLYIITKIKKPSLVVEVGSGFGYSAYWFAKAIDKGKVVLTDYREENINMAKQFFEKGKLTEKAEFYIGDGIEIAKNFKNIDIFFLDLEKSRYLEAVKSLKENISKEGLIIADNVLWHGNVIKENVDKKTDAIKKFNEYMFLNYFSAILPVRDGLLLALNI